VKQPLFLPEHVWASSLMAIGSALLALRATHVREWAFLLLEGVWCLATVWALWPRIRVSRSRT